MHNSTTTASARRRLHHLQAHLRPHATAASPTSNKLLAGLRVIELATVIAAPCACALLADMGAEVVRIDLDRLVSSLKIEDLHDFLNRLLKCEVLIDLTELSGANET